MDWIEVWRTWRLVNKRDIIILQIYSGLVGGIFGVIVLLNNKILCKNLTLLYPEKLFSKISTDWSAFILLSISASCSTLSQSIQPYIMMFLPWDLTEPWLLPSITFSSTYFYIHYCLYDPNLFVLFLSDKIPLLPVLHSLLPVLQSKGQVVLCRMCSKKWLFFFIAVLNKCFVENFWLAIRGLYQGLLF